MHILCFDPRADRGFFRYAKEVVKASGIYQESLFLLNAHSSSFDLHSWQDLHDYQCLVDDTYDVLLLNVPDGAEDRRACFKELAQYCAHGFAKRVVAIAKNAPVQELPFDAIAAGAVFVHSGLSDPKWLSDHLMRAGHPGFLPVKDFRFGPLCVHHMESRVTMHGQRVPITLQQYHILTELIIRKGEFLNEFHLKERMHDVGSADKDSNFVQVQIGRLRAFLNSYADPEFGRRLIRTFPGMGYRLVTDQAQFDEPLPAFRCRSRPLFPRVHKMLKKQTRHNGLRVF